MAHFSKLMLIKLSIQGCSEAVYNLPPNQEVQKQIRLPQASVSISTSAVLSEGLPATSHPLPAFCLSRSSWDFGRRSQVSVDTREHPFDVSFLQSLVDGPGRPLTPGNFLSATCQPHEERRQQQNSSEMKAAQERKAHVEWKQKSRG